MIDAHARDAAPPPRDRRLAAARGGERRAARRVRLFGRLEVQIVRDSRAPLSGLDSGLERFEELQEEVPVR